MNRMGKNYWMIFTTSQKENFLHLFFTRNFCVNWVNSVKSSPILILSSCPKFRSRAFEFATGYLEEVNQKYVDVPQIIG